MVKTTATAEPLQASHHVDPLPGQQAFDWGTPAETVTPPQDATPPTDPQPPEKPTATAVHAEPPKLNYNAIAKKNAELDHADLIETLTFALAKAALDLARKTRYAKSAAKAYEFALDELQNAVDDGPRQIEEEAETKSEPSKADAVAAETKSVHTETINADYETILRSAKLADLKLTRDGKQVSLKGSIEKLTEAGVVTIWDWENLRRWASEGKAEYPLRIRKDNIEEAVAEWIGKNWKPDVDASPIAEQTVAEQPPEPTAVVEPPKADPPKAEPPKVEPSKAKQPQDVDLKTYQALAATSLLALAMPPSVVLALEADGITDLAKLSMTIEARTFSPSFTEGDVKRIRSRLEQWKTDNLPTMLS